MPVTLADLAAWMRSDEDEHLEFKEAKGDFKFDKLRDYCAALANEGGGRLVLGVTDRRPRRVVGSRAFGNLQATKADLLQQLHIRVEVTELVHQVDRVLIFEVPKHPLGLPVYSGAKLQMRGGEGLVRLSPDLLRRILDEAVQDYSAEPCEGADAGSLDADAIREFRVRWHQKSGRADLLRMNNQRLLEDAELLVRGRVTVAALVLFGTQQALAKLLPQAELVFEYRSGDAAGPAQDRREFRRGFLAVHDEIWKTVNLRNDKQHYQDGLFIRDIQTFDEAVVREAILNAVSHRDYRLGSSVIVRQYPRRLEVISPGGFPEGVNPANILWQSRPRNRRIADALGKCGMVERSGVGADIMFGTAIRESKPMPDYTRSDDTQVFLSLDGVVQDPRFLRYMERAAQETQRDLTTEDLLVLNFLRQSDRVPDRLADRLPVLSDAGLIERIGQGRGVRYILAKRFYYEMGERVTYTRRRGLDRRTLKALLIQHLTEVGTLGSTLGEIHLGLRSSNVSYNQVKSLLRDLKKEGSVHAVGRTRAGRWFLRGLDPIRPNRKRASDAGADT